ncbi:acetyl-CoA carboxylase biotin carboxyl carrier protein [Bacillaceae bacterium S4-13-58]
MLKIQEIREIIKLIDESTIHEFTYEANGEKVKLKKEKMETTQVVTQAPAQIVEKHQPQFQETVKPEQETQKVEEPKKEEIKNYNHEIVSPMVGTFYSAPNPESEDYVQVGSKVSKDTVVCIVEAMKLFNEIEAEVNGEIVEVLAGTGELIEYGQPLFRVKTQ